MSFAYRLRACRRFGIAAAKTDYHKVTFEVTFLGTPGTGASNFIEVYALPNYYTYFKATQILDVN